MTPKEYIEISLVADKLDRMGKDLFAAGVPGYGLSLKNEAEKLRSIMEGRE